MGISGSSVVVKISFSKAGDAVSLVLDPFFLLFFPMVSSIEYSTNTSVSTVHQLAEKCMLEYCTYAHIIHTPVRDKGERNVVSLGGEFTVAFGC